MPLKRRGNHDIGERPMPGMSNTITSRLVQRLDERKHELEIGTDAIEEQERCSATTAADRDPEHHAVDIDVLDLRSC